MAMDHADILERGLVALYRKGRLGAEEEQRFEEHFFACAACQEELDDQRRFELGLQAMRAEDAVPGSGSKSAPAASEVLAADGVREGKLLRFPRRATTWLALAASLLIAAGLPFTWLWQSRSALEREAAIWRDRARQEEGARKMLSGRLAESERRAEESDRNAERLRDQLAESQAPLPGRDPIGQPIAGTPLLLLTHLRGPEATATANRLDLRKNSGIVQLALDAGDASGFVDYRVTLSGAAGKKLFAADALHPNALEVILLTFPHDFFAAGEYRLRLEGRRADGRFEEIEGYRFRVER